MTGDYIEIAQRLISIHCSTYNINAVTFRITNILFNPFGVA